MPRRHTKKHKTRRHRKMKGGYYSFEGATAPGSENWVGRSEMGGYTVDKGGNMTNMGPNGPRPIFYGRGRHKKSRGRKTRRRMKGGGKFGGVSASYLGTGSRGIADRVGINTRGPPLNEAANGAFNNLGADSLANNTSFDILP